MAPNGREELYRFHPSLLLRAADKPAGKYEQGGGVAS